MSTDTKRKPTKKRVRVDKKRWPGVYQYELQQRYHGRADIAYTITFKDPITGKKVWEKIGKKSEGITPQLCAEIRGERTKAARHGSSVKTSKDIQRDAIQHNRLLREVASKYFLLNEGSLKGHKTDLNRWKLHLEPLYGSRRVSSLGELDIQRLKVAMKGKAPATIWNALELLRRLCNWGSRNKMCPPLPFTLKMPDRDNEVVEYLTPDEAARLDKVLAGWGNKDVVRMIKVAMLTGMRRGEIFKLQSNDIDWRHSLICIRSPKGRKTVTIPMSEPVAVILREQLLHRDNTHPDSQFVFPGAKGTQRVDCSAAKRIKDKAELPSNFRIFHGLRHHFAIQLANSGQVDLSMIGALLTHKSEKMTKRYAQYLPETTQAASILAAKLVQENIEKGQSGTRVVRVDEGDNMLRSSSGE